MHTTEQKSIEPVEELPDSWWYRVYLAVVVVTAVVITTLWAFSRYFSG
ncbi:MAG TPA: hypothetical protein VL325_05320 [Pyrinomonadaceae bacterium]|jgi:hypothetical protein|nr:hypothetical protein [Pyrinomonadaceae bacterium]